MSSVTQRVNSIKQPWGGYIRASQFNKQLLDDGKLLNPIENVHPSIIGMAVDYLTRFMINKKLSNHFLHHIKELKLQRNLKRKRKKNLKNILAIFEGWTKYR